MASLPVARVEVRPSWPAPESLIVKLAMMAIGVRQFASHPTIRLAASFTSSPVVPAS
jgi:hypothetical protein